MRFARFGRDISLRPVLLAAIILPHFISGRPSRQSIEARGFFDDLRNATEEIIDGIKDGLGLGSEDVGGYAPFEVVCPSGNIVRNAGVLSLEEKAWLDGRRSVTAPALTDFLERINMEGFHVQEFMNSYTPTVAMAYSGGGYRAMLSGAGVLSAFDSRTENTTNTGGLGGLLQGSTYFAGLSGGSWLVGTVAINNFTSVPEIQSSSTLWNLEDSILNPKGKPVDYFQNIISEFNHKSDAGFDVTITDIWSLMLARQLIDKSDGDSNKTFSSIADSLPFRSFEMPFPILVADGRAPGEKIIALNTTVFEINPLEFGSHDPTIYAFTKTKLLGSDLAGGTVEAGGRCVNGFDNAAYMMGTSSSLFNAIILNTDNGDDDDLGGSVIHNILVGILEFLSDREVDIANWTPNPFLGVNPEINPSANTENLTLVDGGLDLENIPLNPLLVPNRKIDVIFASDNSADVLTTDGSAVNWPNGTAMVATYERSVRSFMANGTAFPSIPDQNTFVNLGLNARPTWFGCDAKNFTGDPSPLIVYLPNAPYSAFSNTSTFKMSYTMEERDGMIKNGQFVATQGDGVVDPEWPACVGCAVIHREMERRNNVTEQCQRCLQRYCWDGTLNNTQPATYEPEMKLKSL